jgi:hypothetical protein
VVIAIAQNNSTIEQVTFFLIIPLGLVGEHGLSILHLVKNGFKLLIN